MAQAPRTRTAIIATPMPKRCMALADVAHAEEDVAEHGAAEDGPNRFERDGLDAWGQVAAMIEGEHRPGAQAEQNARVHEAGVFEQQEDEEAEQATPDVKALAYFLHRGDAQAKREAGYRNDADEREFFRLRHQPGRSSPGCRGRRL